MYRKWLKYTIELANQTVEGKLRQDSLPIRTGQSKQVYFELCCEGQYTQTLPVQERQRDAETRACGIEPHPKNSNYRIGHRYKLCFCCLEGDLGEKNKQPGSGLQKTLLPGHFTKFDFKFELKGDRKAYKEVFQKHH